MVLRVEDIERNDKLAQDPQLQLAIKHMDNVAREVFYNVNTEGLDFNTIVNLFESRLQKVYDEWYRRD
jgi:hypothetical protein